MSRDLYDKLIETGQMAEYVEILKEEHCGNGFWNKDVLDIVADFIFR